ncbi:MAG: proprotein convertase P-domain-containing protein, partial [Deltaproteobacteria bacterium]|nr:proprotein convertase P-domain-containing protein [Deltaproteobacteria bacterium]
TEICDGQDNDCVGGADFDLAGEVDVDVDGVLSCEDCDDNDTANYPGNTEICDGQDNDCDGAALGLGYSSPVGTSDNLGIDGVGNAFSVTTAVALATFSLEIDPSGTTNAVWQVWDATSGTPVLQASRAQVISDSGRGVYVSPSFSGELLAAGGSYMLTLDFGGNDGRYYYTSGPSFPGTTPFGQVTSGVIISSTGGNPSVFSSREWNMVITGADETDGDSDGVLSCNDCDDSDINNYPGNTEACDGFDNDCNLLADADGAGEVDVDLDLSLSCDDCDDGDEFNFPGNSEACDGQDNDCDASTEAGDGETDDDTDGFLNCEDCADLEPTAFPGGVEVCDGLDNNCDAEAAATFTALAGNSFFTGANRVRGNAFQATRDTLLSSFAMSLTAPAGAVLNWGVYEGSTQTGDYSLVASVTTTVPAALAGSRQYISSGALGVLMEAGSFYALVLHIDSTAVTYYINNSVSNPTTTAFGTMVGGMAESESTFTTQPTTLTADPITSSVYDTQVVTDDEGDFDSDLYLACEDCDDGEATMFPGNDELCDDLDNDCSGTIDVFQQVTTVAPGLGFGASPTSVTSTIEVAENASVADVNVTIDITHIWDADVDVSLTSPTGTVIDLTSDNGGGADNFTNTVFDDEADTPITAGSAPFAGSYIPETPLSTLDGELSAGTWTLTVTDDFPSVDDGTLNSWTLDITLDGGACTSASCLAELSSSPNSGDGYYVLNPSGVQGTAAEYYCDMTNGGWTEVFNNDFDVVGPDALWSQQVTTDCGGDTILGGFNVQAGGTITLDVDVTDFVHTEVRVETEYWAVDSWDGETAWVDVGTSNVWFANPVTGGTNNICGNANTGWTENIYAIDNSVSHSANTINYIAGSNLDQPADDESFAVDDVILYVR